MRPTRRTTLAIAAAGLLAASAATTPAAFAQRDPGVSGPVTGSITLAAKGAAAGVGYTWGDGVLTYKGRKYPFSVSGITVADVGFSRITGHGRVYHLAKLQDFSGTYAAATGEATLGNGIGGQVLQNGNGVQIRIDQTTRGARLQGSADGIKLTLK